MQEGVPSGIGIVATSGVGDEYRVASLPQEIEVSRIDGVNGFPIVRVVLETWSMERELGKKAG